MTEVVIALGSNLGDRLGNLRAAVRGMEDEGMVVTRRSAVWETAPVPADQPRYFNAVVVAETELGAEGLLAALKRVEHALGRRPSLRWGPRPADLDLLFFGDETINAPELQVPHPRIMERAFVLVPLAEVFPGALPVFNVTALSLLAAMSEEPMRRVTAL